MIFVITKKQQSHSLLQMKDTQENLQNLLSQSFSAGLPRLFVLSRLILMMLVHQTVNLSRLSNFLNPQVAKDSNYKRLQRFIREFTFCGKSYVQLVLKLFADIDDFNLSMDRTNWRFGKCNINILMIGICYKSTAIPLIWVMLDKRGNSNQKERITLMKRLLSYLSASQRAKLINLLMDREFVGENWISYLKSEGMHFVIRIKKNSKIRKLGTAKELAVYRLFQTSQLRVLRKPRVLFNHRLYVSGQIIKKGQDYLILISDIPNTKPSKLYAQRWGIEVFFACCKSRGFNFEQTHLTKLDRINTLTFIIALCFIWSIKTGEYLIENGYKIPIKAFKDTKRKAKSIFKIGLEELAKKIFLNQEIQPKILFLSCT